MLEKFSPREVVRKGSRVSIAVLALTGCAHITTEGVQTKQCLETSTELTVKPGQQVWVGDVSVRTVHSDAFTIANEHGAITYHQTEDDGGKVTPTDTGFDYLENDKVYHISYDNNAHDLNGPVKLEIQTACTNQ